MRLVGERVVLRPIEREDLPTVLPWWNDPEVMLYTDDDPHPRKSLAELVERHERETGELAGSTARFVIETVAGRPIGDIVFYAYRADTRSAWMGVMIGERASWGQGYGSEAIRLFLRYLFEEKGLHKVSLTVSDFNTRAIRAYEKCGFRHDGALRDEALVDGVYVDHLVMSLLEDEYRQWAGEGRR
jgi:RimJ/RimL family protein N-acetyltransferase